MPIKQTYQQISQKYTCHRGNIKTWSKRVLIVLGYYFLQNHRCLQIRTSNQTNSCACQSNILASVNRICQNVFNCFALPFEGINLRIVSRLKNSHPFLKFVCVLGQESTDQDGDSSSVFGMGKFQQLKFGNFFEFLFVFLDVNSCQLNFQILLCLLNVEKGFIFELFEVNLFLMNQGQLRLPERFLVGDDFAKLRSFGVLSFE